MADFTKENQFTPDQQAEIDAGIKNGVDVSVYAKPEFLAIQMHEIRIGLVEQIPVSYYADSRYDWFQMEEIRKGLEMSLDVSKYADPEISFDKMRQIRKGLEAGIDLSDKKNMDAGVLQQLRKATLEHIDLSVYINKGFDEDQLHQIRLAKKNGVDIDHYIIADFRGISIREIRLGLEHHVDVSVYASREYTWQQMREIRLGMEKHLDVSQYKNVLYSWQQMREIRYGLEEGMDVGYYCSFMYTAKIMRERRLDLLEKTKMPIDAGEAVKKRFTCFDMLLNQNGMEAIVVLLCPGKPVAQEEVLSAIRESGIKKGVDYAAVKAICDGTTSGDIVTLARGVMPQAGTDGWYEYFFDTEVKSNPMLLEDGSVDYQHAKWFELVKKGQKVAVYHEAQDGTPGYTIMGESLATKKGKEKPVLTGSGFEILEDKKTYIASVDGKIELKDNKLIISNLLVVDDVTSATGNIDFNGSVYVRGNVGQGVSIHATRDVLVDGYTESSVIEAGGDIILKKGNNASGRGFLRANGDVMGMFFESARVWAGGKVRANYCLRSEIHAGNRIEISGRNGVLAGGLAQAQNLIQATHIGNEVGLSTRLVLGNKDKRTQMQVDLQGREKKVSQELRLLLNAYQEFRKKFEPVIRNVHPTYLKLEDAIYTKKTELEEIRKRKEAVEKEQKKLKSAKVVVTGNLYSGVSVEINGVIWRSEPMQNVYLVSRGNRIGSVRNV